MNIFILDKDPKKSVSYLVKTHLTKMPLETAQILCSPYSEGQAPYKRTHYNHPCCVWARESKQNYEWLLDYAELLFNRFETVRCKPHSSYRVVQWCKYNYHNLKLPDNGFTQHPQCMTDEYKNNNVVTAYRNYYMGDKRHLAEWDEDVPYWWI